jgi:hypothetical protein
MVSDFVCKNALPGFGCGYYEMAIIGFIFIITGLVCIYFLVQNIRAPVHLKPRKTIDSNIWFWIFMAIWMVYRGVIFCIPFNYNIKSLLIVQGGVNAILALIPISMLVLLICELLFSYKNPGYQTISFFKCVFIVFLSVFLIVGIAISFIANEEGDLATKTLALWHGCTDLIVLLFVTFPAHFLIKAISYPVIQPDDVGCITKSKIGTWVFGILFFLRSLYNTLHYFNVNPLQHWLEKQSTDEKIGNARAFTATYSLIFEYTTGVLSMIGVCMIRNHDMKFSEDPFYARGQSDSLIVAG